MHIRKSGFQNFFILLCVLLYATLISYRDLGNLVLDIDLTILTVITFVFSLIYFFVTKQKITKAFVYCIIFSLYVFVSLLWTRSFDYGLVKISLLLPFVFITYFLSKLIIKYDKWFKVAIIFLSIYSAIILLGTKDFFLDNIFFRLTTGEGTNPNKLSKYYGFALITLFFFLKTINVKQSVKIFLLFFGTLLFGLIMFLSGAKGAIFGLLSVLLLIILITRKSFGWSFFWISLLLIFLYVLTPYLLTFIPDTVNQFIDRRYNIGLDEVGSISSRLDFIDIGIKNIGERGVVFLLLGNGIGDFSILAADTYYPHNIVIEVLYEFGILGIIFLISSLTFLFRSLKRAGLHDFKGKYYTISALYFFVVALTTGDISGNFNFFIFLLISYIYNYKFLNNIESKYMTHDI